MLTDLNESLIKLIFRRLAIAGHGVDINDCNTDELKELEKNILLNISGGYQEFHKGDTFSKEDYYKIDTPWGTIGADERPRNF